MLNRIGNVFWFANQVLNLIGKLLDFFFNNFLKLIELAEKLVQLIKSLFILTLMMWVFSKLSFINFPFNFELITCLVRNFNYSELFFNCLQYLSHLWFELIKQSKFFLRGF